MYQESTMQMKPSSPAKIAAHRKRRDKELAAMSQHRTRPMLSAPELTGVRYTNPDRDPAETYLKVYDTTMHLRHHVEPSHLPVDDDRLVLEVWGSCPMPWDTNAFSNGVPIFSTVNPETGEIKDRKPRAHREGVGWCRYCHEVARTSKEVRHATWCKGAEPKGAYIPAVLDGPGLLHTTMWLEPDAIGSGTHVAGPCRDGVDRQTTSEQTPELWSFSNIRRSQLRRPVTVGHVTHWNPAQPLAWMTAKTQPHVLRYRAEQEARTLLREAGSRWALHAAAGSVNIQFPRGVPYWKNHTPCISYSMDTLVMTNQYGWLRSWAARMGADLLTAPEPPVAAPVTLDVVLKHDLTPYKSRKDYGRNAILAAEAGRKAKLAAEAARKMLDEGTIG